MENRYAEYGEVLSKLKQFNLCIVIMMSLIIVCLIIFTIKLKYRQLTCIVCILGALLIVATYISSVAPYQKDIDENAYTVYYGEFYVEQISFVNRGGTYSGTYIYIKFPNEKESKRYRTSFDIDVEDSITYNRQIVTSNNTDVLLEIIVENDKKSNQSFYITLYLCIYC